MVASNSLITTTSGSTPFHTLLGPPEVETGPAVSVTQTKAELTGTIDTLGDQTTYHFEYGLTTAYGSKCLPALKRSPATNAARARSAVASRPAARHDLPLPAGGQELRRRGSGADRTFTTSSAGAARVYEQVSPTEKLGGTVQGMGASKSPRTGLRSPISSARRRRMLLPRCCSTGP